MTVRDASIQVLGFWDFTQLSCVGAIWLFFSYSENLLLLTCRFCKVAMLMCEFVWCAAIGKNLIS